jgi:uncharacterized protein involved in exopolysaccharide biosynthesis
LRSNQLTYGPDHPETRKNRALIETIEKQIDQQIQGVFTALEFRASGTAGREGS